MATKPNSHTKPLTISELSRHLQGCLETYFRQVWLQGELSQLKVHQNGHVYLTLKDEGARLDGVIWQNTLPRIPHRPDVGVQVVVRGYLSVYPPRGTYQLIIESLEPVGLGALRAAFERLKAQLEKEGLFDPRRKRRLPFLPRAVGVITSPSSAARQDIQTVLHRRSPQIPILLCPAQVQGPQAAADIAQGLYRLSQYPEVEVIIVGRGGGEY